MRDHVSVPRPPIPQVLADPVVDPTADPQPLVVGEDHQPMRHHDVASTRMREVTDRGEDHHLVADPTTEAPRATEKIATQIVMTPEHGPRRAVDRIDLDVELGMG